MSWVSRWRWRRADQRRGQAKTLRQALARVREMRSMSHDALAEMALRCRESAYRIEACADGYERLYERVIRDRWLYPPERAGEIRPQGIGIQRLRPGHRRIRRYPFRLG